MIIEAVLENQIIGSLEDIEGAEDYQIIGSRTVPEDGDTKSEDNNSIGVIAVSVGYRSNDNFSLPMLSIPVTLQICTRTEEDATGVKHETFVSSLASKLSYWHLHGDMMTAKFSSQKFMAGELTLNGGSGRKFDDSNKCWSENVSFTIRGSERFSDDEYKYDIDWDKVNNPPSINGVKITSTTTLDDIDIYSKEEVDEKIDEVRSEIESISGISSEVEDIKDDIENVKGEVSSINQFTKTTISTLSSNVSSLSSNLISTGNELADVKRNGEELSEKVDTLSTSVGNAKFDITQIKSKIPTDATQSNKLASQAFVNSSINNFAAFYLTKDSAGNAFGSYVELSSATKFYNAGVERTPTKNDYLVILEDETKTTALSVHPTTRYTYQGTYPNGQWEYQYTVNNTALTQSQVDAINSTITKEMVELRVYPSTINPHYAANSDWAETAAIADYANTAAQADYANTAYQSEQSYNAEHANNADTAMTADYATQADQALTASYAYNADTAMTADYALTAETANYADNAAYANVAEYASNLPTPLEGMTFDFTNNAAIYESLSVLITMLGGTVIGIPQKAQFYKVTAADDARIVTIELLTYQIEGQPVKSFFEGNIQAGSTIAEDVTKIGLGGRAGLNCIIRYVMNGVQGTVTSSGITWIDLTGDLTITYAEGDM